MAAGEPGSTEKRNFDGYVECESMKRQKVRVPIAWWMELSGMGSPKMLPTPTGSRKRANPCIIRGPPDIFNSGDTTATCLASR